MDKQVFLYLLIEAIVFLIPVATLFIKIGGYKKTVEDVVEKTKGLPEWKAETGVKITQLELQTISQQHVLDEINKNIVSIATKMDLLLDDKLKLKDA